MTEDQEIEEMKLRRYGQCPRFKGHMGPLNGFFIGLCVGIYVMFFAAIWWDSTWRDEMVRRGFAHHDSKTGAWMWNR